MPVTEDDVRRIALSLPVTTEKPSYGTAGFRVKEIPIVFEDRRVGQSKMSRKIFLEGLTMVWKLKLSV